MKKTILAISFLMASVSVAQADEVCGKIESINVSQRSVALKSGQQIEFGRAADTVSTLVTALANDLTVCFDQNGNRTIPIVSISK